MALRGSRGHRDTRRSHDRHPRLRPALPDLHPAAPLRSPAVHRLAGTRPPTCRRSGNEARAAALGRDGRADAPLRTDPALADQHRARRAGAARPTCSAPTCARSGATGATPTRCPSRWCSARQMAALALRARLAHAAAGQRLGRLRCRTCARCWRSRARRPTLLVAADRPVEVRRADGPLRARHDAAPKVDRVFGELRQWLPGLIERVRRAPGARAA